MIYKALVFVIILLSSISCSKKKKDFSKIEVLDSKEVAIKPSSLKGEYLVFTFLSPECPLSENYTKTLKQLAEEYMGKGVQFYYIFPGTFYPRPQIEQFAIQFDMPLDRFMYDVDYQLRDYCKASTTPETYLLDSNGKILYSGAIDNWAITLGKQRQVFNDHYLDDAITSVLNGDKIKVSKTRAVGCIIE